VRLSQADEIISEEQSMRHNLRVGFTDGDTITALRNAVVPKRAIVGTPWYQLLSNPKYSNAFVYIGAYVDERHKVIEDGAADAVDEDGNSTETAIRHREEQSDLVMVLLNLAYIPDDVVKKIPSFKAGWSY
jgi:hypothetical protein